MAEIEMASLEGSASALLIYVTGDFTRLRSGSHVRFSQMITFALKYFSPVFVYSFRENQEDPWTDDAILRFHSQYTGATLVLESRTQGLLWLTRLKNLALMLAPQKASAIAAARLKGATPEFERLTADDMSVSILVNFADGITELNGIRLSRAVVDTHDSKYIRFAKLRGKKLTDFKSLMRLRAEIGILSKLKGVVAISKSEAGFFRVLLDNAYTALVPVYEDNRTSQSPLEAGGEIDLLFVGSNNVYNREGIMSFIKNYEGLLNTKTLHIVGSVCSDPRVVETAARCKNVRLCGWVDDLEDAYRSAKVVIAPVDGTGLNIKVVEALGFGKPVIASGHVIDALPEGSGGCVFPLDVETLSRLTCDPKILRKASEEAYRYATSAALRGNSLEVIQILRTSTLGFKPNPPSEGG